jgi:N-acetylmuramoyl-L-alanine amidase
MFLRLGGEGLQRTKLKVVREAVRHNVASPLPKRRPNALRRRLDVATCLIASLVFVSVVHGSLPRHGAPPRMTSPEASPGDATPSTMLRATDVNLFSPARASLLEEVGAPAPERLPRAVFPLAVKRVVVDPGHGGRQSGAISVSGLLEKDLTLDIALRLRRLMRDAAFDVMMTRETDEAVTLADRVSFANARSADLFVSVHVNWVPRRERRPLETYFVGPTRDAAALKLASLENQESGYTLADYRELLEKVYLDTRRDESRLFARTINDELYQSLRDVNPGLENWGVKSAPFAVLLGTRMPAILAEVGALSNAEEVELLTGPAYREMIATALFRGIRAYVTGLNGMSSERRLAGGGRQ